MINESHDPNVTPDHSAAVPAESIGTTDHVRASASTDGSHPLPMPRRPTCRRSPATASCGRSPAAAWAASWAPST